MMVTATMTTMTTIMMKTNVNDDDDDYGDVSNDDNLLQNDGDYNKCRSL
jgi:hypothetical protein